MNTSKLSIEANTHPAKPPEKRPDPLVAAAAKGDSASFEVLVRRYKRTVLAVGRRMTRSIDDAEDIAQQTFMKAFAKLSLFRGECSFSTWLMSIAINEARMWRRKQSRQREVTMFHGDGEEETMPAFDVPDLSPDPESLYFRKERNALLAAKLNQLRPTTRVALELCDLQEESTNRTAQLLGLTVSAVKSRRSRGRAELRSRLACHHSPAELCLKSDARESYFG